jgi:hypothetical protein
LIAKPVFAARAWGEHGKARAQFERYSIKVALHQFGRPPVVKIGTNKALHHEFSSMGLLVIGVPDFVRLTSVLPF